MPDVVLLAHGSPDPRHGETMQRIAARLREREEITGRVQVAYLEHEDPRPEHLAVDLADDVRVVPMLITPAYHARVDVPEAAERLRAGGADVTVTDPLGGHAGLLQAVAERLSAHGHDPAGPVVLVAGGNRDGSAVAALHELLRQHGRPGWVGVDLSSLEDLQHPRAADRSPAPVLAFMIAEGVLHDRVRSWAQAHGAPFVPGGLEGPALDAVVLDRVMD